MGSDRPSRALAVEKTNDAKVFMLLADCQSKLTQMLMLANIFPACNGKPENVVGWGVGKGPILKYVYIAIIDKL